MRRGKRPRQWEGTASSSEPFVCDPEQGRYLVNQPCRLVVLELEITGERRGPSVAATTPMYGSNTSSAKKVTVPDLRARKGGEKIAMVTAYDFTMARLADEAGVDMVLVGDSLGMVVQGLSTTIPVSLD